MDKSSLQPLSGFRDQLEPNKSVILEKLKGAFQAFGYQEMETPIIERQEILLGKLGTEAQKLLYLFKDNGQRPVGLRYDLTVPLSRYVAANYQQLPMPFKRFEIGPVFRAEKPQVGRIRQFTQADIDIVGYVNGEKEMLEMMAYVVELLDLKIVVIINDRRIVEAILLDLKVKPEIQQSLLRLLDKKDKISPERLSQEFDDLGLTTTQKKAINSLFLSSEDPSNPVAQLLGRSKELEDLEGLVEYGKTLGLNMKFNLAMVRGLDYYTGTIFECVDETYAGGTLIAGGRYDSLAESLIGEKLPAVGISFGVDRLGEVAKIERPEILFIACIPETESETRSWAEELRRRGLRVEVYLDSAVELGKQIKYADKRGYARVILPLDETWKKGMVEVKDLKSGRQTAVKRDELANG